MKTITSVLTKAITAAAAMTALAAPALAQDWYGDRTGYDRGYYDQGQDGYYRGDDRRGDGGYGLRGPGVDYLHPALRSSREGRDFVFRHDGRGDGWISVGEARNANRDFFRIADRNRDGRLSGFEIQYALGQGKWRYERNRHDRYGWDDRGY